MAWRWQSPWWEVHTDWQSESGKQANLDKFDGIHFFGHDFLRLPEIRGDSVQAVSSAGETQIRDYFQI